LFPCRAADATQTGALAGVPAGATAYQAAGEAAAQTAVYQAQGSATVQAGGSAPVSATLAAVPGALGASQLTFQWTFGGQSCATAGVSQVTLTVSAPGDPSAPDQAVLPCTDGAGADGTAVAGLAAGSYPFVVAATGASATYHGSGTVHVDGLPADALAVDVPLASEASATGSLAITWTLGAPCADGGVDHVHVFLVDPQGAIASDATGATTEQTLACGDAAGAVYGTLLPGGYFVDVQGLGGGAVISQSLGTQVAVLAGGDVTLSVAGAPLP
ncbi:MAG TPA: hypothetical protein VMB50_03180, partial [Myxococcales bacterium]|nr:hypothetical protein [Myxococcales bacterium]